MRIVATVFGVICVLLGGLWLVQGLGLVRIDPIACVGDCTPLEGASMQWAIIGAAVVALGLVLIAFARRRRL
jgi:MYXO-CTERM domain-containing protein